MKEELKLFDNYVLSSNKLDKSSGVELLERINSQASEILLSNCTSIYYDDTIAYVKYFKYKTVSDSVFGFGILRKKTSEEMANKIIEINEQDFRKHIDRSTLKSYLSPTSH